MTNLAPIVLFTYNRLWYTQQTINSLLLNPLAKDSELFIFSDGWKNEKDKPNVESVRSYLKTIEGFKSITIYESKKNKGLANSTIEGVTQIINQYHKVIVLEDDLLVATYFLDFMNEALVLYENEVLIGNIQGHVYSCKMPKLDSFIISSVDSLGWGTWKRAWVLFEPDGKKLLNEIVSKNLIKEFNFEGAYPFIKMLRYQIEGKNNSWAIRWRASLFLNQKLSVNVGKSLIQHIGWDGAGTHCNRGAMYKDKLYWSKIPVNPIIPIEENRKAKDALKRMYWWRNTKLFKGWVLLKFYFKKVLNLY